jgi:3-oxoacid CoA-transferase subunit B
MHFTNSVTVFRADGSGELRTVLEIAAESVGGRLGPRPPADSIDADVIDAGKSAATLAAGAAIFDQAMSFAMIRGGWIDIAKGSRKLVDRCSYPLTGRACVNRIYTELAVISVAESGLSVLEVAPGVDHRYLQSVSEPRLDFTEVA